MARRRPDDDRLRRLYRDHVDAVFGFLAYSVGRQTAEDLTATTFERAIRAFDRYDATRASERTWLMSIARNALIDHHRRQVHRRGPSIDEHPLLADSLVEATDASTDFLDRDGFVRWLADLGERERTVLALRYGGDLTAAEIADYLDLSEANVHQIVSRTLRRLRTRHAEQADAPADDGA